MKIRQLLLVFGALLFGACATRSEKPTLAEFIQSVQAGAARTTANNQSARVASIQREKSHSIGDRAPDDGPQAVPPVVSTIYPSRRPSTAHQVGSITFDANGGTTQRIGNTYFHSNGTSTQKVSNTYFNSGGGTTHKVGNTYFHSGGGTTQQIGNTYFHSDGSTSQRIGNIIINN